MLLRLGLAAAVFAVVALAVWLWRRPPRRLSGLDLSALGIREPAIVQFSSRYCTPCMEAEPTLRAEAERAGVRYEQIDVGESPDVARTYGIRTTPTIVVTARGGRVTDVWTALPENGALAAAVRRARRPALRV